MNQETVAIANLGCKANQYDGTYMAALLQSRNFRLVDFKESADIYIINTCTVTDRADLDSRNLIRRAHRRNPDALTVVTGCYAQTQPKEVAGIEGVRLVLGNDKKAGIIDYLEKARRDLKKVHIEVEDIFRQRELETFGMSSHTQNTRAYVKIQDGCNQFCSFCIIPFSRGRNRSIPITKVLEELNRLHEAGFYEAILTGIHIGTYGRDRDPQTDLLKLLQVIEKERPIHRVRISSIDPEEISEEMVDFLASSEIFCPHLHIPLQSGDDKTLKMMRRRYSRGEFSEICQNLSVKIPGVCLGTDVMVGFPYEDEEGFQNTYDLLESTPVSYFHVFPFSPKRGTPAARMLGQVPPKLKKDRASRLRDLSQKKSLSYRRDFLGSMVEVILEQPSRACHNRQGKSREVWTGFSKNYLPVLVSLDGGYQGKLVQCKIKSLSGGKLVGEIHQRRTKTAQAS